MRCAPSSATVLHRRDVLLGGCAAAASSAMRPAAAWGRQATGALADWSSFRRNFILPEGRVVDTGNGGVSHSEGQGVGLLCAARFGDQATFQCLLDWTQRHLSRADDALHAWCFHPDRPVAVPDQNNATDGDMLIALALFTAADRWREDAYRQRGLAIARDVRGALLRRSGCGMVLLPGASGFATPTELTVNPSYYIFPAIARFARELPDPVWQQVWDDGVALLGRARFGRWSLSPDWAAISGPAVGLCRSGEHATRSSYDAVRVPLYLCWASLQAHPAVQSFVAYWRTNGGGGAPAWSDLDSGDCAAYPLSPGMEAIRQLANMRCGLDPACALPPVSARSGYYDAALTMLVHVAVEPRVLPVA